MCAYNAETHQTLYAETLYECYDKTLVIHTDTLILNPARALPLSNGTLKTKSPVLGVVSF